MGLFPRSALAHQEILLLTPAFCASHNCVLCYKPTRILRSSGLNLLSKPSYNLNSYGKRAFSCTATELWNEAFLAQLLSCGIVYLIIFDSVHLFHILNNQLVFLSFLLFFFLSNIDFLLDY